MGLEACTRILSATALARHVLRLRQTLIGSLLTILVLLLCILVGDLLDDASCIRDSAALAPAYGAVVA